jgi:multidrug efflux pump subunit AcrA (membrane-fusion protein)
VNAKSLPFCIVLWASAASAAAEPPAPQAVVEVGTVSLKPVAVDSWIPGSIVSRADARIASVIAGRVVWIADVGTRVRQGEPIARLDDTVSRLRFDDLRAQVARARAQHDVASSTASTAWPRPRC